VGGGRIAKHAARNFPADPTGPSLSEGGAWCSLPRKGETRDGLDPRGPHWVQLRFATGLTSEEYVKQRAWQSATLQRCPVHPAGGCGIAGHGSYERKSPASIRVPRWYCAKGHVTVSLLPDFAASRLSSSLDEVEQVATEVATATSLEAAASRLRPDIELPGAVRWTRRRVSAVRATLVTVVGLLPAVLAGVELTIPSFRSALNVERVLPALRQMAASQLSHLPPPVGFGPRSRPRSRAAEASQHEAGPDPPKEAT
jgi:hypothetical protein